MPDQTPADPILAVIHLFKQLDDLVPVRLNPSSRCGSTNHAYQASATLPPKGSVDEYSSLILEARTIRDTYSQRRGEISQELCSAQEMAKLHELRLSHTLAALSAVEDLLGEVRARFRAKGIPVADPRHIPRHPTPRSESVAVESVTINPGTERVEPHVVNDPVSPLIFSQKKNASKGR